MPAFQFLKLPFLAQELILLCSNCSDITDFSLCSKKCKIIVQSIRHPFTGIHLLIAEDERVITVMSGLSECSEWAISWRPIIKDVEFRTINKKKIRILKTPVIFYTYTSKPSKMQLKNILDYLMSTFKLQLFNVEFRPDGFDYQNYIPILRQCQTLQVYNLNPIPRADYQRILDITKPTGRVDTNWNFIE